MPLSRERLEELQGKNEVRIERCRETKALKKANRHADVYKQVSRDIRTLTKRELFLCGLFLYWGEGTKTIDTCVSISNTDPSVLILFIKWLELFNIPAEKLKIKLHLYSDMDIETETAYWLNKLELPVTCMRNPYIKSSNREGLSYTQKFTHGTCNLTYEGRDVGEYIHLGIQRLQDMFAVKV